MNSVLTFLESQREVLCLERYGAQGRLSCVVITPRFRTSSHVVFMVLARGRPVFVAKVPRLAGAAVSVAREAVNLRAVQALRPGGFDSIPRVVAFERYGDRSILVETALVGRALGPAVVRGDRDGWCAQVVRWLIAVQRPSCVAADAGWFTRLVEQPLDYLAATLPFSDEEQVLLARTRALVAPLCDARMPLVCEHGDLSHPNVLVLGDGAVGVLDWELAEPHGLPMTDLFFFLTYVAFSMRRARTAAGYLEAFQSAFFGRSAWVRSHVGVYAEQLGVSQALMTPLFVVCWARYVANLLWRLGDAGRSGGRCTMETALWLRANRYYVLWRQAVAASDQLAWTMPRLSNGGG